MKRAGFTMIELIFVIVILGILAAVALPKFVGISDQANEGKCAAAAGTLNRTVGPVLWAGFMAEGDNNFTITEDALSAQLPWSGDINASCGSRLDENASKGGTFGAFKYKEGNATSSPEWEWSSN